METQSLINAAFTSIGVMMGAILKAVWDGLKELRAADASLSDKVQRIEVLVAGMYVKREDFDRMTDVLFAKLDKIEAKLDTKANASDCPTKTHQ